MSEILNKIKNEIQKNWDEKNEPLLFSTIGAKFQEIKSEPDFKGVQKWIRDNINELDAEIYKDNQRPEYIGLIPNGKTFRQEKKLFLSTSQKLRDKDKEKIILDFFLILSNLDEDDLKRVKIPTDIIVKLIK